MKNEQILHNQLYQLSKDFEIIDSIECAFYIYMLLGIYRIIFNIFNIEIGITFANLNDLHTSIMKTSQLQLIISKLEAICGKHCV